MTTPYKPLANSLPAKVIGFFAANPEETLSAYDIADKFDAVAANVHTCLALAIKAGALVRTLDDDGMYLYRLGTGTPPKPRTGVNIDAAHLVARKAPKPCRAPVTIDFAALKVEEGIPYQVNPSQRGSSKWAPLFAKLTKPGQSIAIPAHARGAVGAAVCKQNKKPGKMGKFRVALEGDHARVWRIA